MGPSSDTDMAGHMDHKPSGSVARAEMPLSSKHIFGRNPVHHAAFLEASVYTWHGLNIQVSEKDVYRCAIPAVMGADIFLPRSVTKHYSLMLKITTLLLHGLCKRVRELMVYKNRWLTLWEVISAKFGYEPLFWNGTTGFGLGPKNLP